MGSTSSIIRFVCGRIRSPSLVRRVLESIKLSSLRSEIPAHAKVSSLDAVAIATRQLEKFACKTWPISLIASHQEHHVGSGCTRKSVSSMDLVTFAHTLSQSFQSAQRTTSKFL